MYTPFSIIAAYWKRNYGIGFKNMLPWPLIREDMQFFQNVTTRSVPNKQNALIMGKNTALSIPTKIIPFSNRHTIICSKSWFENEDLIPNQLFNKERIHYCPSLNSAIIFAEKKLDAGDIFLIGGHQIFSEGLGLPGCDKVFLTELDFPLDIKSDVYFPMEKMNKYVLAQEEVMSKTIKISDQEIKGNLVFKLFHRKY